MAMSAIRKIKHEALVVTNWRHGNYILQPCTINCHTWTHMAMLDVAVDVSHAESCRGTWELLVCNTR